MKKKHAQIPPGHSPKQGYEEMVANDNVSFMMALFPNSTCCTQLTWKIGPREEKG
jgi:hypothetical protein